MMNNEIRELINKLNYYTKKYDEGHPEISDKEWDDMYFQLIELEKEENTYYPDSPTQQIKYEVVNELKKVEHNHKMLSLDKTKNIHDVIGFIENKEVLLMTKCDGLTCSLYYDNGELISAETRGNGLIGEDITHNIKAIPSIPNKINYKDELIIDGEVVCLIDDFSPFAYEYKNPRNFAAGSIRLLDSQQCSKRKLTFIVWDIIKGFEDYNYLNTRLDACERLGFYVVPRILENHFNESTIEDIMNLSKNIPSDGIVIKYNDIEYGKAQGETAHHFKNAIAYKFYDDEYETTLKDIEWSLGRTGVLTPVAIFEPIDIDGSTVSRANLHNISVLHDTLGVPFVGQKIWVAKMNMIIPQIVKAEKEIPEDAFIIPYATVCPVCGRLTRAETNDNVSILYCDNPDCSGKLITKLDHYCSKKGLDIRGLSKATLEKLIDWEWVNSILDIYSLEKYKKEWILKPGFGSKSVQNILDAIEESKNCTLEAFITALGIPLIGQNVARELIKYFTTYEAFREAIIDNYDFSELEGFADGKTSSLLDFDYTEADKLSKILNIAPVIREKNNFPLKDKKYVITGSIKHFKNRPELQKYIEDRGGKVVGSISKNVNYLINNDINSTSVKNIAAKKLNIPIITEEEFLSSIN